MLTLTFDAGFADIFEVKDELGKVGNLYHRVGTDQVLLGYQRDDFKRETLIRAG